MKKAVAGIMLAVLASLSFGQEDDEALLRELRAVVDESFKKLESDIERIVREAAGTRAAAPGAVLEDGSLRFLTETKLKEILNYIASDDLEGRCAGSEGETKATEFYAHIFKAAGLKPMGDIDEKGEATFFQSVKFSSKKKGRNVIGLLEGSDEKLKEEVVIIGGHHDHLGKVGDIPMAQLGKKDGEDDIFNGADDNASGSATVAALAIAFGKAKLKPKRSILFMTFTAEEWGLIGSSYYVKHPAIPLEKTVAMINLDMVGRNPDKPCGLQGFGSDKSGLLEQFIKEAAEETGLKVKLLGTVEKSGGDSDHSSFIKGGIPSVFFFTGPHKEYHKVGDEADKISFERIEAIGKTVMRLTWKLANAIEKTVFNPEAKRESDPHAQGNGDVKPSRRLGITPDYMVDEEELSSLKEFGVDDEHGAVKVQDISPDTVAEKCGLKAGDYILSIDGKEFSRETNSSLRELIKFVSEAKARKPVKIVVIREKKKVTLEAIWEK